MEAILDTQKLKELVVKAVKGASNNKLLPITGLMEIKVTGKILSLTTTDMTNFVTVTEELTAKGDFCVVVPVETFSKLIAKTTAKQVVLSLQESSLQVKGNGKYDIELPLDEGKLIEFPKYDFNEKKAKQKELQLSALKVIINNNKASLARTSQVEHLMGILFADRAIASDSFKAAATDIKLFDQKVLLSPEAINLIDILGQEKVIAHHDGEKILFETSNAIIYTEQMDGKDEYPEEAIMSYIDSDFPHSGTFIKLELLNILDRMSLFVGEYDDNSINIAFNEEGMTLTSKKNNAMESLKYQDSAKHGDFSGLIDISWFKDQITSLGDKNALNVNIWFGNEKAIKLVENNLTLIVSLKDE